MKCIQLSRPGTVAVGLALFAGACAADTPQDILIDGSSTVFPITQEVAEEFLATNPPVDVVVEFSGTGGGFEKFCAGETQINNASRPISTEEIAACRDGGIAYIELPIAFDALTVVVNEENDWVDDLTLAELQAIWEPGAEGNVQRWDRIRPEFPDRPLTLFGPGTDSGTFDYFTEAVIGTSGASRRDYVDSEDDEVIARGVIQDPNALGYFGFAYYEANSDNLKAVAIDSGTGPVLPSREAVHESRYQPLARPLFIYVNNEAAQTNSALRDFVEFYLERAPELAETVGYIALTDESYHIDLVTFHNNEIGTVFGGQSQFDLTIPELQRRRAEY